MCNTGSAGIRSLKWFHPANKQGFTVNNEVVAGVFSH